MLYQWTAAPGAILAADMLPEGTTEIEVVAQRGTTIEITGADGAEMTRDGRALASAKSKSLAASGKPVVIRNPGKGLRVEVKG